jgi:MAP3K TRAFs-binding domain
LCLDNKFIYCKAWDSLTATERLLSVLTLARAGATTRAWDAFVDAGLEAATCDPKTLTLKGRLLKDRARKARGEDSAALYFQSAKAYADAAALKPDSYPLINAATMSLFAGQADHMRALANEALALIEGGAGPGETPYWHSATRSEAMLLLGDVGAARTAFAQAVTHAPNAWEDHATTLRQFRQILAFRGQDDGWLARFAPPPSLYFCGMMGLAANDTAAKDAVEKAVADIAPGFGYGAIAAGADILIAESLVGQGAELHIVLPCIPSMFKAVSVEPFGPEWSARFDALFEIAATVEIIDCGPDLSAAAVDIASQVAKGRAVDNAARLESAASGLMVSATAQVAATGSADMILKLKPSVSVGSRPALASSAQSALVASFAASGTSDDHVVMAYDDISGAEAALVKLRVGEPDATLAVSLGVTHESPEARYAQIGRMLRSATRGTTIAGAEAAMALKARNAGMSAEPLGELPDVSGAISLYAIAMG